MKTAPDEAVFLCVRSRRFANTGNSNGSGNSPWPRFPAGDGAAALPENIPLSTFTDAQYAANHHGDFWDTILLYRLERRC